ncbi:MAG: rRNA (adenine-N6)-dimethyltransferase, partial [Micromonosporaceae bacterium]|nr:rRNA (adenine-N6)-dimethyltransferase [Micromonosporaceae bacterium]
MSGRDAAPPGRSGAHFLRPRFAAEIVRSTGVGPHDLVLDLGAGLGALTAPLAATGARVIAVERDLSYVRRLTARFADWPGVRVVSADLLAVPLPRRPFRVVANIPFA